MAPRDFWMRRARRLAWRRNFAAALAKFLPALLCVSAIAAAALLLLRTWKSEAAAVVWWPFGAIVALVAIASCWLARGSFLRAEEALAQLDEVGRLRNRLTSAHAGVGEWPPPQRLTEPVRWRWSRIAWPVVVGATLLAGAAWLPVPQAVSRTRPTEQPLAWTQLDSWVQTLDETKLVEPEALDTLRQQLDELRQQPPEQWYSQSSLEAGDTLRDQTEHALRGMLQHLEKAEQTLAASEKSDSTTPAAQLQALNDSLGEALQALGAGNLPLNRQLLGELKSFDASKAPQLTPEQLAAMRQNVQSGRKIAEQMLSPGANLKDVQFTDGRGQMPGGEGGGGEPAPLTLRHDPTELRTTATETISNQDVTQPLPADVIGVESGEHRVDPAAATPQLAGGDIATTGRGGEAVRRESFTPKERQLLQRYFK
jgi:hypothetical protein